MFDCAPPRVVCGRNLLWRSSSPGVASRSRIVSRLLSITGPILVVPSSLSVAKITSAGMSFRSSRSGLWVVTNTWVRSWPSCIASHKIPAAAGCNAISGSSIPIRDGDDPSPCNRAVNTAKALNVPSDMLMAGNLQGAFWPATNCRNWRVSKLPTVMRRVSFTSGGCLLQVSLDLTVPRTSFRFSIRGADARQIFASLAVAFLMRPTAETGEFLSYRR